LENSDKYLQLFGANEFQEKKVSLPLQLQQVQKEIEKN